MNTRSAGANVSSVADLDCDEKDALKFMSICGALLGLRGHEEHAQLTVNNLTNEEFEAGHDYKYYSLQNLCDKSCTNSISRIRIDEEDPADAGGFIQRFVGKEEETGIGG